jgi:micrococcal nuclease
VSVARLSLVGLAALAACGATDATTTCGAATATVERVIDGDTIVLPGDLRIRYLLVNAPETTLGHTDCYGSNASQFNSDLVLGKTIALRYDTECLDMYGRTLAYVSVDGQDVNRLLVERGYACVLHVPPDGDDRADEFKALQAAAKAAKRGLWGACDPIPCN